MSRRSSLIVLLAMASLVACGSEPDDAPDSGTDAGADSGGDIQVDANSDTTADVGVDATPDVETDTEGCSGSGPMCTFGCGGDAFETPTCVDDRWVCPEGTTPMDECPPGSCFGLPLPGEVCDEGWQCRPWENDALPACDSDPVQLCAACDGFPDEFSPDAGCSCTCSDGFVDCHASESPVCSVSSESTLPGVHITIAFDDDCEFTLAEAAAGITFTYEVVIDDTVAGVVSTAQDAGGCDQADVLGLAPFERFAGGDQNWCICDEGLCAGVPPEPVTLEPGQSSVSLVWHGRNFDGPSDTGFEEREPFPPGDYTFSVRAIGTVDHGGDALPEPFAVSAEMAFRLVD